MIGNRLGCRPLEGPPTSPPPGASCRGGDRTARSNRWRASAIDRTLRRHGGYGRHYPFKVDVNPGGIIPRDSLPEDSTLPGPGRSLQHSI